MLDRVKQNMFQGKWESLWASVFVIITQLIFLQQKDLWSTTIKKLKRNPEN